MRKNGKLTPAGITIASAAIAVMLGSSTAQAAPRPVTPSTTVKADAAPPSAADLQQEVNDLKQQLANLKAQQDNMLQLLSQLTDMAQGKQPAPDPAPTPAAPAVSILDTTGLSVEGPSTAKVAMVEFTDFECTYCGQYAREVYPQIYANYVRFGKIQYFYHPMPLAIHPHAVQAAEAAQCAADQGKFWDMHDSLFANQSALAERDFLGRAQALGLDVSKFSQCMLADKYSADLSKIAADWAPKGVAGTPTFFIGILQPNGILKVDYTIDGALTYDNYQKDLDAELAKG